MGQTKTLWNGLAAAGLLCMALPANAMPVYGTAADFTGVRDNDQVGGLTGSGDWIFDSSAETGFVQLDWSISENGSSFEYLYTWSGLGLNIEEGDSRISNMTLDVSDECFPRGVFDESCVDDANGAPLDASSGELSGIATAVKFDYGGVISVDDGTVTYSFTSNRVPVWGDLCLKDGGGAGVCPIDSSTTTTLIQNSGFGNRTSDDPLLYIARPDSEPIDVPAPAGLLLFAVGLLGLFAGIRTRA